MRVEAVLAPAALLALSLTLHGCGGGGAGGDDDDDDTTTTPTTTPEAPTMPPTPMPPASPAWPLETLGPMRAISYRAQPCTSTSQTGCSGIPPAVDLMQTGYGVQWKSTGRNDLALMKAMGANTVRLYHSLGSDTQHDHSGFLEEADSQGLKVLPCYHTQMTCPDFDCFDAWKEATAKALRQAGFKNKNGTGWHESIPILILMNEPDTLNFAGIPPPTCAKGQEAKCRVRAALSALDGVLAAEEEAGLSLEGLPNLTIAWTSSERASIDGKVHQGVGTFGFQDMVAGVANPGLADYKPRSHVNLVGAFHSRWTHSVNTHAPWDFIQEKVAGTYDAFKPKPWFVAEYRGTDDESMGDMKSQLSAMDDFANSGTSFFGSTFFEFQTNYLEGGNKYGMFGLGSEVMWNTDDTCREDENNHKPVCAKWQVSCLTPATRWKPVRAVWGNSSTKIPSKGFCAILEDTEEPEEAVQDVIV